MTYNDTNEAILISNTTYMYYIPKIIDVEKLGVNYRTLPLQIDWEMRGIKTITWM